MFTNFKLLRDFGIRALFGTLLILAFAVVFIRFGLALPPTLENLRAIGEIAIPVVMFVLGFYFGQRINNTANGENVNNHDSTPPSTPPPP